MKKDVKERLSEQVKKLSREELEKKYLNLLFKTFDNKKNARLNGVLGSMISINKKKKLEKSESRKEQYHQQLEHPMWTKKREVILKRDNYQCRICGSKHNLQVHHIKYSNDKKAWEYPNLDLITLCEECHKKVHADKNHELNPYKK